MPKQISTPLFLRAKKGSVLFAEESTNLFVFALDQKYLRDFYNFTIYKENFRWKILDGSFLQGWNVLEYLEWKILDGKFLGVRF